MIKEMLNYMENDGTIPKREVVTPPDPDDDDDVTEVQHNLIDLIYFVIGTKMKYFQKKIREIEKKRCLC